jgi:hypothetical protein
MQFPPVPGVRGGFVGPEVVRGGAHPVGCNGLSFRGPPTPPPPSRTTGRRAEESTVGSREAGRGSRAARSDAQPPDRPVRGRATSHEESESRFLSRAPRLSQKEGPLRRSFEMTGRRRGRVFPAGRCAPCGMQWTVIPRPAHTGTCVSPERSQGRGIYHRIARDRTRQPRRTVGRATAGQGRCGGSRRATRNQKADFSVARRVCRRKRVLCGAPSK